MKNKTPNPVVVLSLEGLKRVLQSSTVRRAIGLYCEHKTPVHLDRLAIQIALEAIPLEVFPKDRIEVHYPKTRKGRAKGEVAKIADELGDRIELLQGILRENEIKYRENMFARIIEPGGVEWDRLVRWTKTVEEQYQTFTSKLPEDVEVEPERFYQFYADRAYELVPGRTRMSVQNLAATSLQNDIGAKLSQWFRMLSDPHRHLTRYMIREVVGAFSIAGEDLMTDYRYYDRIRGGLVVLLEAFFPDKLDTYEETLIQRYIRAWVAVAAESYEGYRQTVHKEDLAVLVGFVGGNTIEGQNTALRRLEDRLKAHNRQTKEQTEATQTIQTPKKKRNKLKKWQTK